MNVNANRHDAIPIEYDIGNCNNSSSKTKAGRKYIPHKETAERGIMTRDMIARGG